VVARNLKAIYQKKPRYVHADLLKRDYCEWRAFLKKSDKWKAEIVKEYELAELRRVVVFAYENTSGYRRLYDSVGVNPATFKSIDDFERLPYVTKDLIRTDLAAFSVVVPRRQYITTGGSTGKPFGFYRSRSSFAKELASKAHQYSRLGWKEGDRQMILRGLLIPSSTHMKYYSRFNELRCSSYHLVPEFMDLYINEAWAFHPRWVKCYPSAGYIFARHIKEKERTFPVVKGLLCTSESLYPHQKELLSAVFKTRIFCHYGHYEMAALAGFCEYEDTYHVLPQYGYVELIDQRGERVVDKGKVGEIVATSFINDATIFIRYRTGDLARLRGWACDSCGRPYQIWDRIEGRWLQEFVVTATDRYISMTALNMHDDVFDKIKQFQFYQESKGEVSFRYIPKEECTQSDVERMKNRLLTKLGDDVELNMEAVNEIQLTHRGKHRFVIQKLKLEFQDARDLN
jgi:phenylacetate-CoA ligase